MSDEVPKAGDEPVDHWLVDRLLSGTSSSVARDPLTSDIARLVHALRAPADATELAGEHAAVAAFEKVVTHGDGHGMLARRASAVVALIGTKLILSVGAAVAATSAAAVVAAYSGALPEPLQELAHHVIRAPAAHPGGSTSSSSSGTAPLGSPTVGADSVTSTGPTVGARAVATAGVAGLCHAYLVDRSHGSSAEQSTAFRRLEQLAGGVANVDAYCAAGYAAQPELSPQPSTVVTVHPSHAPTAHPSGTPSTHPSNAPTAHPSGAPTAHPSGAPTAHPPHPSNAATPQPSNSHPSSSHTPGGP